MPPKPGQEEPLKRMVKVVSFFMTHPDTAPFREPVDWRGLELYDYPEIIKKMMDLGTIQKKLERNQYSTAWEVAQDIRLVWNNCTCGRVVTTRLNWVEPRAFCVTHRIHCTLLLFCILGMTYNAEGSDFWALAKQHLRRFEDRFRKIRYECTSQQSGLGSCKNDS